MNELVVLRAARNLIAQGWVQGIGMRRNARGGRDYCLVGALSVAAEEQPLFIGEQVELFRAARGEMRKTLGTHAIELWNDNEARIQADVLAAFDKTIRRLVAQEEFVKEVEEVMQDALSARVREKKTLVAV